MAEPESIILAACGPILLHGRYQDITTQGRPHDVFPHDVSGDLKPALADLDLVVGNMTVLATSAQRERL